MRLIKRRDLHLAKYGSPQRNEYSENDKREKQEKQEKHEKMEESLKKEKNEKKENVIQSTLCKKRARDDDTFTTDSIRYNLSLNENIEILPVKEKKPIPPQRVQKKINKKRKKEELKMSLAQIAACKLVVFDLNGVLIHRTHISQYEIRPHALELLNYVSQRCDVAIWTSATRKTVKRIFSNLFTNHSGFCQSRFLFIWAQNQCSQEETEGGCKPKFWKEVNRIHDEFPEYAYEGGTLLVDDSECKLERNPAHTSCVIAAYDGSADDVLQPKGKVWKKLEDFTVNSKNKGENK